MSQRYTILVVDDEASLRGAVAEALEEAGGQRCLQAGDAEEALRRLREGEVNLVLTDLYLPGLSGERLVEEVRVLNPEIPVLVMTGYGTVDSAVALLKKGAFDYICKPFRLEELVGRVARALERLRLLGEIRCLRRAVGDTGSTRIIGNAPAMLRLLRQLPSIGRSNASVILYGESGTGKEVVARAIHALSPRARGPFVSVNCGALPESLLENELFGHVRGAYTDARDEHPGLIREADGGSLLLDEVGEMSLPTQVKLLRFLQDKEYRALGSVRTRRVDVRIIAATNRDLQRAIGEGRFREDLYYRLNIIPLVLPPLRERKEDIPLLVQHFLRKLGSEMPHAVEAFSPLAIQKLVSYDWPGNVRELENKIQQVLALATTNVVLPEHIELPRGAPVTEGDGRLKGYKEAKRAVVDAFEIGYVSQALALAGGNVSEAARLARKHRRAFWEIMRKHRIAGREPAPPEERTPAGVS